ncbi:MAG TPA: acyltransferase [Rhizobacter sp.]|nr:acyltransferase [Rhizobacter sp.]
MPQEPPPASGSSTVGLQYLRALAALMVLFHHAPWHYPTQSWLVAPVLANIGSRGVDIFFVISGFVIAHTTRGFDPQMPRGTQALDFWLKRLIRIVPLYWLAALWDAKRMVWNHEAGLDTAKDFLFVPHLNAQGLIWPHLFQGWTINYEMFFYALFALCMLAGRRRYLALSGILLGLTSVGVLIGSAQPQAHPAVVSFYTSNLLFEFLLGVWLELWMRHHPMQLARPVAVGITLAGFVMLAVPSPDAVRGFLDGPAALLIVWSTMLWTAGTELRWLRAVGDASYSIYLFHLAIFGVTNRVFHAIGLGGPGLAQTVAMITLYILFASVLGLAIHRWIEQPMLLGLRRLLGRWRVGASAHPLGA